MTSSDGPYIPYVTLTAHSTVTATSINNKWLYICQGSLLQIIRIYKFGIDARFGKTMSDRFRMSLTNYSNVTFKDASCAQNFKSNVLF